MFFDVILPAMRRRRGGNFRKRLGVYTYKVNTPHSHKKPGVIPLNIKQSLIKTDTHRSRLIMKSLEANSHYPFGKFTRSYKFNFDPKRVPYYNVPDLTGFDLRPYVSVHTTQVEDEVRARIKALNDYTNPANFGRYSETLPTTNTETKETKTK